MSLQLATPTYRLLIWKLLVVPGWSTSWMIAASNTPSTSSSVITSCTINSSYHTCPHTTGSHTIGVAGPKTNSNVGLGSLKKGMKLQKYIVMIQSIITVSTIAALISTCTSTVLTPLGDNTDQSTYFKSCCQQHAV